MDENSFFTHLKAGRLAIGSVTLMLLAITQLIFGWMGTGFLYRVAYPLALMLVSVALFWAARTELTDEEQPPSE